VMSFFPFCKVKPAVLPVDGGHLMEFNRATRKIEEVPFHVLVPELSTPGEVFFDILSEPPATSPCCQSLQGCFFFRLKGSYCFGQVFLRDQLFFFHIHPRVHPNGFLKWALPCVCGVYHPGCPPRISSVAFFPRRMNFF